MQVITLESEAYKALMDKIADIEQYVKQTSELFSELEENLELTSRELMDTLLVSKSTLYRWRCNRIIPFHYEENGNVLYPFKGLIIAIKSGELSIPNTNKVDLLNKLANFKKQIITSTIWHQDIKGDEK